MIKTNFHTHTLYCDGKNTVEEMVSSAIEKKFTALGFSGHGALDGCYDWSMTEEVEKEYFKSVNRAKAKYINQIEIYCGLEQDYFSNKPTITPDYIIGSVHRLNVKNVWLNVDTSAKEVEIFLKEIFNGNFNLYAKEYFNLVSRIVDRTEADVIGHFDLITKYSEILGFKLSDEYFEYAENAVKYLAKCNKPFEINTGAMARGFKSTPYPSQEILKMIRSNGASIMINSDCHDKNFIDYGFDVAEEIAKKIGFKTHAILSKDGIKSIPF